MVHVLSASLEGKIEGFGPIRFTKVEWWTESPKFALLKYNIRGNDVALGVRLDLDKKAFLDDVDEKDQVAAVRKAAPAIWEAVVKERLAYRGELQAT